MGAQYLWQSNKFSDIALWRQNICGQVSRTLHYFWQRFKYFLILHCGGKIFVAKYQIVPDIAKRILHYGVTIWAVPSGGVDKLGHDPLNLPKTIGETPIKCFPYFALEGQNICVRYIF